MVEWSVARADRCVVGEGKGKGLHVSPEPVLPDYEGACNANLVPALLEPGDTPPSWLPAEVVEANQVVLLVLDGLGWKQFEARRRGAPTLAALRAVPITTVAPTTTATALTSITTGTPPGEHGVVGYRMAVGDDVLNVLRWITARGDARETIKPESIQRHAAFCGHRPPVVTRAEFSTTGFTRAHLAGARLAGYRMPSTLAIEVNRLLRAGEPFVYAYYDGIDKVGHEYGLGEHYDAELFATDKMVDYLVSILPRDAALVVTSDHGMVDVGDVSPPAPEVMSMVRRQSGEARFRWLHAVPGAQEELLDAATQHHSDVAWVRSREEIILKGWFGPRVSDAAAARLGDVALVTHAPVAFDDPNDTGPFILKGRHGALTEEEMMVPLFTYRAG